MVTVYNIPEGEPRYTGAKIYINGAEADAYCCRVSAMPFNRYWPGHQRSLDQTEIAAFVMLDMDGSGQRAKVNVLTPNEVDEVWLRPLSRKVCVSRGLSCTKDGNLHEINFELTECGQYVLEMNDHHCPIMFFVNPMKKKWPKRDDSGVIYFGPGVHHPGIIRMTSGQVLFVDEGAVVHTSVIAEKADNIRIIGGGIIDNSEYQRITGDLSCNMPVMLYECENVNIAGVTFRDASCFTIIGYNLRNVLIENVKIIGNWRYNSDGIDLYNSQNVIIRDSFVRTYDDSIVIKAQKPYDTMNCENWLVSGCVVWNDWGHALEIGAETRDDEYRNIRFSDCDVIHVHGTPIDVQNNGDALCHDILFENIRVEYKTSAAPPQMQDSDESVYTEAGKENVFPIMGVYIPSGYCHGFLCGDDSTYGRNRNITFRNIQAIMPEPFGSRVSPSVFSGHSETEDTRNVLIDGLYVNGRRVADREEANLIIGDFASEIEFR